MGRHRPSLIATTLEVITTMLYSFRDGIDWLSTSSKSSLGGRSVRVFTVLIIIVIYMPYKPTIGLEIHAELKTNSKMFCSCKNDPDEKRPNVNICPVCTAQPGT